ncbi:AAWKG family protein [Streptomyces albus]|uniref:AAWKG family protein n=1 Tax=Streptomyces albus TaxID=1888 RepID=UPI0033C4FD67
MAEEKPDKIEYDDYWAKAITLFTGYEPPPRSSLFDEITGNHGIKQMRVEVTKQGSVESVTGHEYDWMVDNAGWDIQNTDFVIPFYTEGGYEGVTYYKARFTLIGAKIADGKPVGGEVVGGEIKSAYGKELEDGHFKPSKDGPVWNTLALTQYSYGTGHALHDLLEKENGTLGYSWGGADPIDITKGVRLQSFDMVAESFDRVARFFYNSKNTMDEWLARVGTEQNDAWLGQAAGVFWDLIHELRRRYDHYADDMEATATTSKPGNALRSAGAALKKEAEYLRDKWDYWSLYEGNPLRWLVDLLSEIADKSWYNNLTQVDADYIPGVYSAYGSTAGHWSYTPTSDFTSNAIDRNKKSYGPMTELDTWKNVGDEAVARWEKSVKEKLIDPAETALRNLATAWGTSHFDLGSISTKSDKGLEESFKEDKTEKEKKDAEDKAAKDKADADAKYEKDKKDAEDKAAKDKADADAKYEKDKKEAEEKAAKEKAEADAKYEKDKKEAEEKAAQEKAEAEAKQAEIERKQEEKEKEAEAKAEAKEKEQEAKQAEMERKQEEKEKEAEAKRAEAEAKQEQIRQAQEAKQDAYQQKQEEAQKQAQAFQIQQANQQRAEQNRREKEQEKKQAEAEAKQEQIRAEQEAKQDRIRAEQEKKQEEAEAKQEQIRAEQEAKQEEIRAEQEKKQEEAQQKQEEIRQEQERKQEEKEKEAEAKQAQAEAKQEQIRAEQEAKQDKIRAEQEKKQEEAEAKQEQIRAEQEKKQEEYQQKQEQVRAEQEAKQDQIREEQEKKQEEYQQKQQRLSRQLNGGDLSHLTHDGGGLGQHLSPDISGPVNGDDSLTNPDGSTSHLDSQGRVVTEYPDRSKVVVDPHTQMATVTRPDGSSYSGPLNAGDLLNGPGGSTVHLDPQGQVVTEYPDGSISRVDPDTGATSITSPDGTTTTGYLNDPDSAFPDYSPGSHQLNGGHSGSLNTPSYDYGDPSYEEELYDDSPYREPSLGGGSGGEAQSMGRGTPLNSGPLPAGMGGGAGMGGMPMGGMPMGGMGGMGGAGGKGSDGPSERVRNVIDTGEVVSNRRPGAAPRAKGGYEERQTVSTSGANPFLPPMGGAGGPGQTETESSDREREVWEPEDDDVWGTDEGGAPAVIGR